MPPSLAMLSLTFINGLTEPSGVTRSWASMSFSVRTTSLRLHRALQLLHWGHPANLIKLGHHLALRKLSQKSTLLLARANAVLSSRLGKTDRPVQYLLLDRASTVL